MTLQPPWAVFVLAEDISNKYIDDALKRAYDGNFEAGWLLWIATDSYSDLPPPKNFASPWINKTVEDCAAWLSKMPPGSSYCDAVNRTNFIVMDEFSIQDDTVLTCRWKKDEGGEVMVEYFPQKTENCAMEMWTNDRLKWDEKATNYQRSRMRDGKPDRSRTFEKYT